MFFISAVLISLLVALAARKPMFVLIQRSFRYPALLWMAVGLHLLGVPAVLSPFMSGTPQPGFPSTGSALYLLSLSMLVVFTAANRRHLGIGMIGLGLLLNLLVIGANGGQMPVDPVPLAAQGALEEVTQMQQANEWATWTLMGQDTRLAFLGDWIVFPLPFREPVILSIGDFVIAAGIALFFLWVPETRRQKSVTLSPASRLSS